MTCNHIYTDKIHSSVCNKGRNYFFENTSTSRIGPLKRKALKINKPEFKNLLTFLL